jgi:hypothetical protein
MMLDAAIWASSTALNAKVALACWTAAWMLITIDARRIAVTWRALLHGAAGLCSLLASFQSTQLDVVWFWRGSFALATMCMLISVRQWLATQPAQTFEEVASIDRPLKKHKSKRDAGVEDSAVAGLGWPWTPFRILHLLGLLLATAALATAVYRIVPGKSTLQWLAVMHVVATSILLGVSACCALELTFGSAPRSLNSVNWRGLASVAFVCFLLELLVGGMILTRAVSDSQDLGMLIISRLFAVSILLLDLLAWVIPHRVATFKRTGKAAGWVSLTLAAWLCVLSLTVLVALPSNWPWNAIG